MIKSFFGLSKNPFSLDDISLLNHQRDVFDILNVHSQQGGLCLLMGDPGTGKSVIKEALKQMADKRMVVVTVSRTLHTYTNTLKILCQAFEIEFIGDSLKCEKRLIEEAFALNRQGKMLVTVIDDAHLMEMQTLRKLRLLFEDFPKNHNLILCGQTELLYQMSLRVNEDIRNRVTYSTNMPKLVTEGIEQFILNQMDRVGLGHNVFSSDALSLIARSSDGVLRQARNLTLACLLECVRAAKKNVDLNIVNTVLIQPHWRIQADLSYPKID
jgi:type II secretory pathway predicted ATPase ExeA